MPLMAPRRADGLVLIWDQRFLSIIQVPENRRQY
ncbi:hypothetical protein ALON55S_00244 [Alishewanella longhuensis]